MFIVPYYYTCFARSLYSYLIASLFALFMWNKKHPRCATSALRRDRGGMGTPNMLNYYKATILDQLQFWWRPSPQKTWSIMETYHFPHQDPKLIMMALKLGFNPPKLSSPFYSPALSIWPETLLLSGNKG